MKAEFKMKFNECLEKNFFDPRSFGDLKLLQEIYNKIDFPSVKLFSVRTRMKNQCQKLFQYHEKLVFDMEVINNTLLFSRAHQTSSDFSFLMVPSKMKELNLVYETQKDYDALLIGKTKGFGSNMDYKVSLGNR